MKFRVGFVSNSSTASFIIAKNRLTDEQIDKIINYPKERDGYREWGIEANDYITGRAWNGSFDMQSYLVEIGVPNNIVRWEYDGMMGHSAGHYDDFGNYIETENDWMIEPKSINWKEEGF